MHGGEERRGERGRRKERVTSPLSLSLSVSLSSVILAFLVFSLFFVCLFFVFVGASVGGGGFLSGSQNLPKVLPAPGGTNPYPLAPTMTPLVSAVLGGGPGGNNTGPA
jgi:hypothetical protein